jgi:hypothetical protein
LLENCCVPRQMRETRSDVPGSTIISMSRRLLGAGCRSTYLLRASVARTADPAFCPCCPQHSKHRQVAGDSAAAGRRCQGASVPQLRIRLSPLIRDSFDSCGDTRHFAFRRSSSTKNEEVIARVFRLHRSHARRCARSLGDAALNTSGDARAMLPLVVPRRRNTVVR